jgi:hypothetical protein
MKVGITLNEVLRDHISQFAYTYEKYRDTGVDEEGKRIEFDLEKHPIQDFDFMNHELVNFEDETEMKKFLYIEAALEIFGHADQTHNNIMTHFNAFLLEMKDEEEHDFELVSREGAMSIPSTYFFLSKTLCKAPNIRFVTAYADKWDGLDVLITACPVALEAKPAGKISVKVNTSYNKDVKADFEIDGLMEFMNKSELRDKVFGTKTADFEEL